MKFALFMARRYLTRGNRNAFIHIISLASIAGIAIGVAALIIALALLNGFQNDIRDRILSSTAHIMISHSMGDGVEDYAGVMAQLQDISPEIQFAAPVVFGTVLIKGAPRNASGAVLRGMNTGDARKLDWLQQIESGRFPSEGNELLIGRELALKLGLFPGDICTVLTPEPTLTPGGMMPRLRRFHVTGVFRSGLYEVDSSTLLTTLETARHLFRLGERISYVQLFLKDIFAAETVKQRLRSRLPGHLSIITWKDLNASLYSALELEKTVLFFTLTLIIVVAALNIIAGLILLVIQKIRDIGILRACGVTPRTIQRIFFIQGGIIGLAGTLIGTLIGVVFSLLANRFELIRVPAELYQMSHVHFRVTIPDLAAVVGVALLISLAATLIPSRRAAAVNVVEAVKNE
ncbi:MAG: ABC transporter permease [Acidobacteriota bacterium]|jgi:lipoprotein-releasing system permease protein|nr:ABC transporter permease [Acidobacteriota bacterium]